MAKRTNIERIIRNEIEKGNIYVIPGGNLVSAEMLEKGAEEDFIKALRAKEIPVTESLETFTAKRLEGMKKAEDLLSHINGFFEAPVDTENENVPGVDA